MVDLCKNQTTALAGFNREEPIVSKLLKTAHVHIAPLVNIKGFEKSSPGDCTGDKFTGKNFAQLVRDQVSFIGVFRAVCG